MEDKQIADYFVVAGFTDKSMPLEDFSFDGNQLKSTYDQAPITDITVIIPSLGEGIPHGFTCIEYTPTGLTADLNYGSIRSPEVFLCYRRSRERPPLFDIGVLYQGKEQLMSDAEVVLSTPYGRPANVNNSANQHTYVTYRRAPDTAPCNDLVVSDICVVITSKGEQPPHAYCMIKKNLNKGMLGADVYLCYKKSMNKPRYIAYRPGIQARFPEEDIPHNPMPDSVPLFCLPMGATLEWWPINAATPKPVFSTFVLTVSDAAEKIYGSAVTFYERYPEEKMTKEQKAWLDMEDVNDGTTEKDYTVNTIKSICILSHFPFFDTFEKFLRFLHKVAHSGPYPVPLERYITHFMYDVPFPSPQRPRILIQLSATDRIALAQLEDLPLPRRGASFKSMLLNLGPDGCLQLLLLALTEQKILIHSLRPDVLTATAEALATSIFPFKWQCPYIPLCPLGLSDVLNAPLPYLIGVDSRFFDMYDPPAEVSCVDLDTNTISVSEEKKPLLSVKLLPKKAARTLRATLQYLYEKLYSTFWSERGKRGDGSDSSLDRDFKIKKKELLLELEIQEAFLKFMASILRGYRSFLLPITKAPTVGATDPNSLFDLQGFLRSRDKAYVKFYSLMMKTQMFIRFIEERSFVSDMDSSLAFFDECSDKTDLDDGETKLLELDDSHHSERTVFVTPPEPVGLPPAVTYSYQQFGTLNPDLMRRPVDESSLDPSLVGSSTKPRSNSGNACGSALPPPSSPLARRTKHEIKNSQKFAKKYAETPMLWAKCLLNTCFSIWFIHLPSHILASNSKLTTLRSAYAILVAMQKLRVLPADEVCYRVMMQLCGVLGQPVLAVKVLFEMKRHGVQPNAITYGFYNKAVLEAHWSSDMANHSRLLWNKLRNVVTAAGLFRQAGRKAAQRRLSQYSSTDEGDLASNSDGDGLSRTSVDSAQEGHHTGGVGGAPIIYRNSAVTSSQSDVGYSSMKEDGQANQKPKSSSQKDLPTALKAEESVDICGSRATGNKMAKTASAVAPVAVRLDFSQSDEFRTRVGSIVRKSANAVPHKSVDSAAGVLMSSLGSGGGTLSPTEATELKAALDVAGHNLSHPSPQQAKGATLPREKSAITPIASITSTPDASSQTKSSSQSASTASLFRSASLRLGGMFVSPLEGHLSPAKTALADRLQWARSSIRKKLDMGGQQDTTSEPTVLKENEKDEKIDVKPQEMVQESSQSTWNSDVNHVDQEDRASNSRVSSDEVAKVTQNAQPTVKTAPTCSPERHTLTHGDPLGALDIINEVARSTPASAEVSRLKPFVLPDPSVRLFTSSHSTSSSGSSTEDDSSEDDSSEESESEEESDHSHDVSSSASSRYAGARWSLRKPEFRVNLGAQVLGTALNSLSPQNLNARKAEFLVGLNNLKSAASSVAKKFDEIKGAIGAGVTVTPSKLSGSGMLATESGSASGSSALLTVDGPGDGSLETWSSWTAQWLRRASSADLASQQYGSQPATGSATPSEWSTTDGQASSNNKGLPSWTETSSQLDRLCASMRLPNSGRRQRPGEELPVAIEVIMTSCSKCHNCSSILYDEEIMAGWTPEDSNLNTRCQHCKKLLVPFLTTHLRDFRSHPPSAVQRMFSNLTPGVSQDSVISSSHSRNGSDGGNRPIKGEEHLSKTTNPEKVHPAPLVSPVTFGPISVPYLSPLVLRRELEGILEQEGDVCLTQASFVDQHSIIYWNMLWYFERVGLMSHMAALILRANIGLNETNNNNDSEATEVACRVHASWSSADERNISVKTKWDNARLHDELGPPCYALWQQADEQHSPLVSALVTDNQSFQRSFLDELLRGIQYNDMLRPLKQISSELVKRKTKTGLIARHHGIYRELLFLSFVAIGRENIDQIAFDREYRLAYDRLDAQSMATLGKVDSPPSIASVFCRHFFRQLEL
ncbi:DENN domain-containing protein Crag-like isoform X2 [Daphnia carinata]|uniref:DENN domain-containing protein Crag-like isoform X2 n=1 Tax=Daphnia carinata TaxID=120202 RepID=UPI0028693D3A|nr:DENN domain-containing protein Crag-like isoform X2 [Daphnia carinata]